jgi:hypothetical protein
LNIKDRKMGNRPLGRQRRRWVDNIKIDVIETGWEGMDWIDPAQDRDQWRVLVTTGLLKCWEFLSSFTIGNFSKRAQLLK